MNTNRHTQVGWTVFFPMLLVLPLASPTMSLTTQIQEVMPLVGVLFVVVLLIFSTLNITVLSDRLKCRFGVRLIRRSIQLSEAQLAEAVRNKWHCGRGIRVRPHGWPWKVSGLGAVEVTFTDRRRSRVGTDDPKGLVEAIRTNQAHEDRSA